MFYGVLESPGFFVSERVGTLVYCCVMVTCQRVTWHYRRAIVP